MSIRTKKIKWFEEKIVDFFQKVGREHLPWRKKKRTAYEVWVSEIMLQQTQVSRVIGYYERFLKRFPSVESLAKAGWEEFLPYYSGLGYYARGRNMLRTAKEVVEKYGGKFPRDVETLRNLPGIGPYTAAAIASFAYGENTIAWDTNLRRVVGRFFCGTKNVTLRENVSSRAKSRDLIVHFLDSSTRRLTRNDRRKREFGITKKEYIETSFSLPAKTLNAALMDFGSAICLARPKCEACSLKKQCVYFREKGKQESGIRNQESGIRKKNSAHWKEAQAFVFLHENHRKYFSAKHKRYEPFVVPREYNTRAGIKEWFRKKYRLEVSVRPPHKKILVQGVPTLFVNVQILSGKAVFVVFQKSDWKEYNRHTFDGR